MFLGSATTVKLKTTIGSFKNRVGGNITRLQNVLAGGAQNTHFDAILEGLGQQIVKKQTKRCIAKKAVF